MTREQRQHFIDSLEKGEATQQARTLQDLRKVGDASFMPHVLAGFAKADNDELRAKYCQLLFDLKDQASMDVVIDHMGKPEMADVRLQMVEAVWQSGIDMGHRLPELVEVALSGDYLECLECLTAIENFNPISDAALIQSVIDRIHAVMSGDVNEKEDLLLSIIEVLESWKSEAHA